jgi:choline kinase
MEDHKVLITTSGIGSRLGNLTNFTNKSLVRISDKPAISHIIEYYPKNTPFIITLGHFGDLVKQFLNLTYPDRDFTFVEVDKFQGPGSSLGYSILQAKPFLQCPFIFHASDTILTKKDIPLKVNSNWCVGAYQDDTSQYSTFIVNDNHIVDIKDKGALNYDYCYVGMCGIKDYKLFWEQLDLLPPTHSLSDIHVIQKMLNSVKFKFHKTTGWFDTGNTSKLKEIKKHFKTDIKVLDKIDESIYFFDDFVIKFFSNSTVNKNRVNRALNLYPLVPKILGSTSNFYKYKKVQGKLFSKSVNEKSFIDFLKWADKNLWIKTLKNDFSSNCSKFYIDKSFNRINQYLELYDDPTNINGESLPSIQALFNQIDTKNLCNGIPSQFHGDFILDNIIETSKGFSLIDWRQDFAGDLEIGDIYYDLAKLNHNLVVNHEIVDKNLFNSSSSNCYILCNSTLINCKKILHDFILKKGYDLKKVEILTSIIWLNMAPLHEYPFNKFLFTYGKYNLYKNLK